MPKISKSAIKTIIYFILLAAILITAPCMLLRNGKSADSESDPVSFTLWQIDSFEGGKGSRSDYLLNLCDEFSETNDCYVTVTSLSANAARLNIEKGIVPDLISYGAGTYGLESVISGKTPFYTWAHGGYCFITLDGGSVFNDISADNTIINSGKDNLSDVAAIFCGVNGADTDKPTGAYVKLLNGKYKYLLGTQRDIYRLKTRGVAFSVKAVTEFNDLYQNISVTAACENAVFAEKLINFIIENGDLTSIGMLGNEKIYEDEMSAMEGVNYEYKLVSPISSNTRQEIADAVSNSDIKTLKTILN